MKTQLWNISNLPNGEDVTLMQKALKQLGVHLNFIDKSTSENSTLQLKPKQKITKTTELHLGNSGTCTHAFFNGNPYCSKKTPTIFLDGIERMQKRPILDLVTALRKWKNKDNQPLDIQFVKEKGYPPLKLTPNGLNGGKTQIKGDVSSQFISGLLMAMPFSSQSIEVTLLKPIVSESYIRTTLNMLSQIFDIHFEKTQTNEGINFKLTNPKGYQPRSHFLNQKNTYHYPVEIDVSTASYFTALGVIAGKKPISIPHHPNPNSQTLNQGETEFLTALKKMNAHIHFENNTVYTQKSKLKGITYDVENMSDTGMTLAMVALFAKGSTTIVGISNWRYKETDRIFAMKTELKKLGAKVTTTDNSITITPPQEDEWQHAEIETYNDHRMAMCFSLAAFSPKGVTILNPDCSKKTFPHYFEIFEQLCS